MHVELRKCGYRQPDYPRFWTFKWGFGLWFRNIIFTFGHDTRGNTWTVKP